MEIKVRKPRVIKCFGIADLYARYSNRQYKWMSSLPNDGERIKITWLPPAKNAPKSINAYIGMSGIVRDMDKTEGSFCLHTGTSILIHPSGNFNYERI